MSETSWLVFLVPVVGLFLLVMPRSMMLFGNRWTLKDGDSAEPSDAYALYTRGFGAFLLIASMIIGGVMIAGNIEAQKKERFTATWGFGPGSSERLDSIQVKSTISPRTGPEPDEDERIAEVSAYAVVGDPSHGAVIDLDRASDGDLVLAVQAGSCVPSSVYVEEKRDTLVVSVAVKQPRDSSRYRYSWICRPSESESSSSTERKPWLVVVRLDSPVGARQVVSAEDGSTLTPVTIRDAPAA
ncbi:hypothetical protein [Lysinibacter cavernae]|uniref:DUF6199 domain-containing protein n=1 Tax=Lysinibacter cavernae TaxID=1640652 RepID=A0A7X5TS42_9MICO|nr:hypothetical protein [Lysinibacter cavernae]NIH52480.1 hypothetical protein [Lysinibacter cavernae]